MQRSVNRFLPASEQSHQGALLIALDHHVLYLAR
jgi:hypothetical protein